MLINKPLTNIVATILVKNEEDIIGHNIEHHIQQGVTKFIITDNGSTDNTKSIISRYPEVVEIIDEPEGDHNQSKWVTRMAREACKLKPDWIIHLDADELWCGLYQLYRIDADFIGSTKMLLHPPVDRTFNLPDLKFYLDFESIPNLPGECKVAHRPDPDVVITHGNHGFENRENIFFTKDVWRHHYPIRSYDQFVRKSVDGHRSLTKRNAICERWKKWHDLFFNGESEQVYDYICDSWKRMIQSPNQTDLCNLLQFWSTPDVIDFFKANDLLPSIGCWPK